MGASSPLFKARVYGYQEENRMNETIWVQQTLDGDRDAFANLVEKYKTSVYNLAYRMLGRPTEAEDAAQETFLRAYTRLGSYKPEHKFSSWLLAITAHLCIDHLRRAQPLLLEEVQPYEVEDGQSEDPEAALLAVEREEAVQRLLEALPAHYRLVIVLRYWHDLSYREIAQVTRLSEGAVKTRLHRARRMLAAQLPARSPTRREASPAQGLPEQVGLAAFTLSTGGL